MEKKLQLKHPQGKKAVSMNKDRYDLLKKAILFCLKSKKNITFPDLLNGVEAYIKTSGQTFQGSIPWHMEWVKLDLEAGKVIERSSGASPHTYRRIK